MTTPWPFVCLVPLSAFTVTVGYELYGRSLTGAVPSSTLFYLLLLILLLTASSSVAPLVFLQRWCAPPPLCLDLKSWTNWLDFGSHRSGSKVKVIVGRWRPMLHDICYEPSQLKPYFCVKANNHKAVILVFLSKGKNMLMTAGGDKLQL